MVHCISDLDLSDNRSGEAMWLSAYPMGIISFILTLTADVIKSRLQTDIIGAGRKYSSALDCALQSYRAEGFRTFFRGIGPTLARAAPVNAMVPTTLPLANTRLLWPLNLQCDTSDRLQA